MGARGPVGKKAEAKAGHRTKAELAGIEVINLEEIDDELVARAAQDWPEPDEKWHDVATMWYMSLRESGQAIYYQPSDRAVAYVIAESLSRDLKPQFLGLNPETGDPVMGTIPLKGASLAAYLKGFTGLMATEADRRRLQMELERESLKGQAQGEPSEDGVVLNRAAMFKQNGAQGG